MVYLLIQKTPISFLTLLSLAFFMPLLLSNLPLKTLIEDIIEEQEGKPPLCIIADIFFGWTATVAKDLGVFHAIFSGAGGFGLACYYSVWSALPHRGVDSDEFELKDFKEASRFHVSQLPLSSSVKELDDFFQAAMVMRDGADHKA
ncbi:GLYCOSYLTRANSFERASE [Salix viminalis]|uniref:GLYCOSYLTRANSFERASE n=1 Tax=Salix viminalis TaxID=40686 RepID=A0A9Q0TM55_SALVM|nr:GLYCOSYLTRANSFERASE [Salix viminalis]